MSLQVVISVEALGALVTTKWTVVHRAQRSMPWRWRMPSIHLLNACNMSTVESRWQRGLDAAHE